MFLYIFYIYLSPYLCDSVCVFCVVSYWKFNKPNCDGHSYDYGHVNTMATNCLARMCVDEVRLCCVPSRLLHRCRHLPTDNCSGYDGWYLGSPANKKNIGKAQIRNNVVYAPHYGLLSFHTLKHNTHNHISNVCISRMTMIIHPPNCFTFHNP